MGPLGQWPKGLTRLYDIMTFSIKFTLGYPGVNLLLLDKFS
jgi:hypothetical protein